MPILRLCAVVTVATLFSQPGLVLGQTEDHEQHHPAGEGTAQPAQPIGQQSDESGAPAAPSATGEQEPAPGPEITGPGMMAPGKTGPGMMDSNMMGSGMMDSNMMGSGMMDPERMRMMHERMMQADRGLGTAPVIVILPVPGSSMGPGTPMMADGMMSMMAGTGVAMQRGIGAPESTPAGQWLAAGAVTPALHLSVEDVRHFFEHRLEEHGNPRLTLGKVAEAGEDAITAEIVTSDGSLVERLSVDRHSGAIRPLR
jgi:hypothetical protein